MVLSCFVGHVASDTAGSWSLEQSAEQASTRSKSKQTAHKTHKFPLKNLSDCPRRPRLGQQPRLYRHDALRDEGLTASTNDGLYNHDTNILYKMRGKELYWYSFRVLAVSASNAQTPCRLMQPHPISSLSSKSNWYLMSINPVSSKAKWTIVVPNR